jgi:HTH-type transcriptional regulator/antitoxin MqsA
MDNIEALMARSKRRRSLPEPSIRRLLRTRAALSQQEIADLLGVTRPAVTRWELGERTPRGDLAERYSDVLDRLARR